LTTLGDTTSSPELLIELDRSRGGLGEQLEHGLRTAIRSGRLRPGTALPASRTLALDLGISRRVVVGAYEQLAAEGWLVGRHGSGTFVAPGGAGARADGIAIARAEGIASARADGVAAAPADGGAVAEVPTAGPGADSARVPYDFFPGSPDLASFPRQAWLRALRDVLREVPDLALHYPDPAGAAALRAALAERLGRVRGVLTSADRMVITSGARQGLTLLGRALAARGAKRIAVEWPTLPQHLDVMRAAGLDVARIPVGPDGIDVERLAASGADAALVTPAHQMPLGVALAPERRTDLMAWAAAGERLVIEDDYDAEFRYDRRPLAALQALDPQRVAYLGSASKALAPGLRLGWLALPPQLVPAVVREKELDDAGTPSLEQLTLARLIESGVLDRHLRRARRRYAARRGALVAALASELPDVTLTGMAAGLHAVARLPGSVDAEALRDAARARGVGVYPLPHPDGSARHLVLGYACLSEPAIAEGVRRLAAAIAEIAERS
jgi:GntR family transcriptional regulator/MocR family aminotransferase